MTDYVPIDCDLHSEYELRILQQRPLRVRWRDPDGQHHIETLQPLDLVTRNREEFLVAENRQGQRLEIRLDYIATTEVLPDSRIRR
ncbi:MAG TPA: transcriptional antiterminator, Rof [Gammaproteobacteria bacterium]|nr:transcriptional antiterminator, Rof [Gammaproteobacteria bacterium]